MEILIIVGFAVLGALFMNTFFGGKPKRNIPCYDRIPKEVHKWTEKKILGVSRLYCVKCDRTTNQMN